MKIRVYLKVRRKELLVRNSDILNLKCWVYMFLLLLEDIGLVVGLKSFLMIKVKPVDTLLMRNYLENQKSINLKMIMHI